MKTKFFAFVAIAALCAAACTQDPLSGTGNAGEEVTVNFAVEAPDAIATKAFSDGTTAALSKLKYAVYAAGKSEPLIVDDVPFEGLKATVDVPLVRNKMYDIIFWAQNEKAPYTFDAKTQSVTIDYKGTEAKGIPANDEELDAFYYTVKNYQGGTATDKVYLYRPFAQINVGTNDMLAAKAAGYVPGTSSMSVENVPNKVDLYTGEVSGRATVDFTAVAIPVNQKFPVDGYEYIEMNYILASDTKETTKLKFTISSKSENDIFFELDAVPVRRNYQTNLYGALLTDKVVWDVEISPFYKTDENYNQPVL